MRDRGRLARFMPTCTKAVAFKKDIGDLVGRRVIDTGQARLKRSEFGTGLLFLMKISRSINEFVTIHCDNKKAPGA